MPPAAFIAPTILANDAMPPTSMSPNATLSFTATTNSKKGTPCKM